VASRIDYCNSILYRVAAVHLRPLQSVLNVLKLRKFDRVSISAIIHNELHWLPVPKRIVYEVCLLVFKCQHEQASTYLSPLFAALGCHTQPVVSCGQQPKVTSMTREQELSHTAHGHLQFLDLHVGIYFRLL